MAQSLSQNLIHLVFSTENRHCSLARDLRPDLFAYMAQVVRNNQCEAYRVGGVEDHVHLAIRLHPSIALSTLIQKLKKSSGNWMRDRSPGFASFRWQNGYGAFSVSNRHLQEVLSYIEEQEQHHSRESFQDEFRRLCEHAGVELDERYVWD